MTVGARSDGFQIDDLVDIGQQFDVPRPREIVDQTIAAFAGWPSLAKEWGVLPDQIKTVAAMHRFVNGAGLMQKRFSERTVNRRSTGYMLEEPLKQWLLGDMA